MLHPAELWGLGMCMNMCMCMSMCTPSVQHELICALVSLCMYMYMCMCMCTPSVQHELICALRPLVLVRVVCFFGFLAQHRAWFRLAYDVAETPLMHLYSENLTSSMVRG